MYLAADQRDFERLPVEIRFLEAHVRKKEAEPPENAAETVQKTQNSSYPKPNQVFLLT